MLFKKYLYLIIIFLGITSCYNINDRDKIPNNHSNTKPDKQYALMDKNIEAVNKMINNCHIKLDKQRSIIVTSLVKVNDLTKSSTFGRMSAEIVANRLSQLGYNVKEVKMNQNNIYIRKQEGEFVLSRKLQLIANEHNVQAIVVGTYATVENNSSFRGKTVYICLRIVEPLTNRIGCSQCYTLKGYSEKNWQ